MLRDKEEMVDRREVSSIQWCISMGYASVWRQHITTLTPARALVSKPRVSHPRRGRCSRSFRKAAP